MSFSGLELVIPDKADEERDAVANAWIAGSGTVMRLGRFWEPPESLVREQVRLYGNDTFCLVLEQKLNLTLVSPPEDLLLRLESKWLNRSVRGEQLAKMSSATYPLFAKPAAPKLFRAAVYSSWQELETETQGLDPSTAVLVSEVVELNGEVRSFILGGRVLTHALYEGDADIEHAARMLSSIASEVELPETCVIDLGHIVGRGWGVVEANASWGAGLNGCDPEAAARCIAAAPLCA
jgi:hypothetical protein